MSRNKLYGTWGETRLTSDPLCTHPHHHYSHCTTTDSEAGLHVRKDPDMPLGKLKRQRDKTEKIQVERQEMVGVTSVIQSQGTVRPIVHERVTEKTSPQRKRRDH